MKALIMIGLLAVSTTTVADIYKFVAPNGLIELTNVSKRLPKSGHYQIVVRSRPRTYQHDLQHLSSNKQKYDDLIAQAAARHQINPKLLHAVIQAESAYNARAVSNAGALGLMQLMPDTARRYGVDDPLDAAQNIDGGTRYLKDLLAMFNNLELAVAGYNAGEGAVIKYNNTIPPYPETQNYVQQVLALLGKG